MRKLIIKKAELSDSGMIKAVTTLNERTCKLQVIGKYMIGFIFEEKCEV